MTVDVGNGSLMAALDAGYARTLAAEAYVRSSQRTRKLKKVFTPLVFLSLTPSPRFTPSFLYTTFLKYFLPPSYHQSIMILIST